jgi:hypothetical protein
VKKSERKRVMTCQVSVGRVPSLKDTLLRVWTPYEVSFPLIPTGTWSQGYDVSFPLSPTGTWPEGYDVSLR